MNAQFYALPGGPVERAFGQPLRVARTSGELTVLDGRVWVTRRGDLDDHVLDAGERIVLEPADEAVIEPWSRDATARLAWRPLPRASRVARVLRQALGAALRGVAGAGRAAATGFDALARRAASFERRAQGCV